MKKSYTLLPMILLAALFSMSVSGCRSKIPSHVPNEYCVYRTTREIELPAGSLYFINPKKEMEVVTEDFVVPKNWSFTGPIPLPKGIK